VYGDAFSFRFTKDVFRRNENGFTELDLADNATHSKLCYYRRNAKRVGTRPIMRVAAFDDNVTPGFASAVLNSDPVTILAGVSGRALRLTPQISYQRVAKLAKFWAKILPLIIKPLASDTDVSLGWWLEHTNYTTKFKDELLALNEDVEVELRGGQDRRGKVGGFKKEEAGKPVSSGVKIPLARGIYARSNFAKMALGPICKQIEHVLFYNSLLSKYFIKPHPVITRPRVLDERLNKPGLRVLMTDFSTFEACHRLIIQHVLTRPFFKYMVSSLPMGEIFMRLFDKWIVGENKIKFDDFEATIWGRTMSGEMITSLVNCLYNLVIFLFSYDEQGIDWTELVGFFEGDDGAMLEHKLYSLDEGMKCVRECGADLKLEIVDRISIGSFCGNVYSSDYKNISNPWRVLGTLQWLPMQYLMTRKSTRASMARARAMSLLMEKPGPIVTSYARMILHRTRGVSLKKWNESFMGSWLRERWAENMVFHGFEPEMDVSNDRFLSKIDLSISIDSRLLMEDLFHISVENQIRIEDMFEGKTALDKSFILSFAPMGERYFYEHYSDVYDGHNLRNPSTAWLMDPDFVGSDKAKVLLTTGKDFNERIRSSIVSQIGALYGTTDT